MAPTGSMRAVVYHTPGDASVLQVEERPIPRRGDGEVLIKQYSASVNPVDFKMRSSNKEHLPKVGPASGVRNFWHAPTCSSFPCVAYHTTCCMQIPGGDISGIIEEVGPDSKVRAVPVAPCTALACAWSAREASPTQLFSGLMPMLLFDRSSRKVTGSSA